MLTFYILSFNVSIIQETVFIYDKIRKYTLGVIIMPKTQITFITILLLCILLFTACNDEKKETLTQKRVLLEGNASEEYYHLAQKYFADGEYEKALALDLKQLEEDLKYYKEISLEIALDYNNIGLDYDELKNHEKALDYYLKTIKIDEITLEENSTERSTTYYNVASTYDALEQYPKAIEYYEKALELDKVLLGAYNEDVLSEYEGLAIAYGKILKPKLSLKYWKKSLNYKEQEYGKYDEDTNETREKVEQLEERLIKKIK
jgi:tetratricopeptide (TPR) repeat protein